MLIIFVLLEEMSVGDQTKKRTDKSANMWVNSRTFESAELCMESLRDEGYEVWVSHVSETGTILDDTFLYDQTVSSPQKVAIVMGSERDGPCETFLNQADRIVFLPQFGFLESLNVSVACGMVLQFLFLKFPGIRKGLDANRIAHLRGDWYDKLSNTNKVKEMAKEILHNPPKPSSFQQPFYKRK